MASRPDDGLTEAAARTVHNQRVLWQAGWMRHGWPVEVGGFGGSPILRAALAEEVTARGLVYETMFAVVEVLLPTTIAAAPALAGEFVEPFLAGKERWCQGFSEPDAGSDLASLRCRAVDDGDSWVVTGQKIWTSYAKFASRILLLARTGTPESRHRGITAMLVDMDSPGVTVRPLAGMNGEDEFAEVFFDEVRVPKTRLIGEVNGGWGLAMDMLRNERGGIFWAFSVTLFEELGRLSEAGGLAAHDDELLGHAFVSAAGLRTRSWTTQHRMDAGNITTPETSIDKILMATSEQELFDAARFALDGEVELGDDPAAARWRSLYLYSRAASIYGGTAEIQRNIVADQFLGLRGAK